MQKSFFSILLVLLLSSQFSIAQSYLVAGIEKTDKEGMQYEVLGKVANRYWIFKKNGTNATIAQYNEQMQLVKQNDLAFLPASFNSIEFVTYPNKVIAFFQYQINTTVFAASAELNSEGQLVGEPKMIDTVEKIRPGSAAKVFNLLRSEDQQKISLFTVNTTQAASIKIKVISLNADFENTNEVFISINSNNKKSNLSDFALDNNGNLLCLRNTTQNGSAPAVSLLYLAANGVQVVESSVINNTLLLDDIRLKIDNKHGHVILNSFYAISKKDNVEGLYSYVWDLATKKEIATTANRFTDAIKAAVSNKRNLKDAFDEFYFDKIITQADGSFVVVAEAASSFSNRTAFSRWDYFWGGPFYNPFMFNYWNRPFGFYPWTRFGFGFGMSPWSFGWGPWMNPYASFGYPSITYKANKVALISMDVKGNVTGIKTIDKVQSDDNVDEFIGYGTIENSIGTTFAYYKKQSGIRQLALNTLTKEGALVKGNAIIIQEKRFEWMPRMLKQVGENEAILPYQYKNKIGFAKIKLNN